MSKNKKFTYISIFLIALPIIAVFINNYLAEEVSYDFSHDNRWGIALSLFALAFLSSVFILFQNRGFEKKKFWTIVGLTSLIISGLLLYLTYSFSNFGF